MGIYIKEEKKPTSCLDCATTYRLDCNCNMEDCPIVEVKEPSSLPKGGSSGDKETINKSELTEVIGKFVEEMRKDKDMFATIHIFGNEVSMGIYHYGKEE